MCEVDQILSVAWKKIIWFQFFLPGGYFSFPMKDMVKKVKIQQFFFAISNLNTKNITKINCFFGAVCLQQSDKFMF